MYLTRILGIIVTHLIVSLCLTSAARPDEPDQQLLLTGKPFVYKLKSEEPQGRGYRLVYASECISTNLKKDSNLPGLIHFLVPHENTV